MAVYFGVIILTLAGSAIFTLYQARDFIFFIFGTVAGAFGLLICEVLLQRLLDPPRFAEFDILIYPFFIFPIGGILGSLTGSAIILILRGIPDKARLITTVGSLPVLAGSLYALYGKVFDLPDQYLSTTRDVIFWLSVDTLPLFWIACLWLWIHTRVKRVNHVIHRTISGKFGAS